MAHSKLTDKQKKQMLAHYAETQNYSETARITGVSEATVRRVVKNMPDVTKIVEQKKEQNAVDVIGFMAGKKAAVCNIISSYLDAMLDPAKLKRASVVQIATALGIIIDKFTAQESKPVNTELMEALLTAVKGVENGGGNGDTI